MSPFCLGDNKWLRQESPSLLTEHWHITEHWHMWRSKYKIVTIQWGKRTPPSAMNVDINKEHMSSVSLDINFRGGVTSLTMGNDQDASSKFSHKGNQMLNKDIVFLKNWPEPFQT